MYIYICIYAQRNSYTWICHLVIHFLSYIYCGETHGEGRNNNKEKSDTEGKKDGIDGFTATHAHTQSTQRHYERTEINMKRRRGGANDYDTFWKQCTLHRRVLSIQTCTEEIHAIMLLLTMSAVLIVLSDGCTDRNTVRHAAEDVRGNVAALFRRGNARHPVRRLFEGRDIR